jgi:hypothetical protein
MSFTTCATPSTAPPLDTSDCTIVGSFDHCTTLHALFKGCRQCQLVSACNNFLFIY